VSRGPEIAVSTTVDGHVLMLRDYTLDLVDLLGLLADILRYSGHGLREDITGRYTPRTVDLLVSELDTHTCLLRRATNPAKDTQ
jgi:hypothetical protein